MPHPSTSSAYGIWSLNEVRDAVRGENWPTEIPWVVNLSNVIYDSVSFSVASQETVPTGVYFSTDGTKMFVAGRTNATVYQYSLSTAFDLSTASYSSISFSVSSQESLPHSFTFNADGTKMYVVGATNNTVYQYFLSTSFDVSTASYASKSFNVTSQDSSIYGIVFNSDGTKFYGIGNTTNGIYQYSLSAAYDISTASYDSVSLITTAQDGVPRGLTFNNVGTKMYVMGEGSDAVYQYSLSTGYDLSTASYDSVSVSVSAQGTNPSEVVFSTTGTKMYVVDYGTDTVYQYSTGL